MIGVDMGDGTILVVRDRLLTGSEPPLTTYELAIGRLTAQLTEANQKKETSATNARYYAEKCCQLETQLAEWDKLIQQIQKAFSDALINQAAQTQENTFLKEQLAERDKLIENQQAEIESRNQLRYDALKGEHSRSPYYYDSWCKLHDHKGVVGTSDKPPIYYAVNLLNRLTEQNASLREEVERLTERLQANAAKIDEEDVVIEWADYLELKAEARKQTAQDCVDLCCKTMNKIITSNVGCGDYKNNCARSNELEFRKQAKKKFGLEG